MIARIGIFNSLPPDVHSEMLRNLRDHFMGAVHQQEGYIARYWLEGEDGQVRSVNFWESDEALKRGGGRANATPLLSDHDPSKIPSADSSLVMTVFAHALGKAKVPMPDNLRWFAGQAGKQRFGLVLHADKGYQTPHCPGRPGADAGRLFTLRLH